MLMLDGQSLEEKTEADISVCIHAPPLAFLRVRVTTQHHLTDSELTLGS